MKSLKETVDSTEYELYAITETNFKQNENSCGRIQTGWKDHSRERWRWSWNMNKRYVNKWYNN